MTEEAADFLRSFRLKPELWMDYAACKGMSPDLFFLDRGQGKAPGVAVCMRCPVRKECGDYADATESTDGIWGGVLRTREYRRDIDQSYIPYPEPAPNPTPVEKPVIPKSLSATAVETFEQCSMRWKVENVDRMPSPSNSAANLGTVCHGCTQRWVEEGHYLKGHPQEWPIMKGIYDQEYWAVFSDASRYDEGVDLIKKWLARQDWSDREVLSTEQKRSFMLPTSAGDIPFNYIMDRMDRRPSNGDIEVVDYKTLIMPLPPEALKRKIQARAYALAAQLEHPEANRIWVGFDMLRYDPIYVVFTKDENRETWQYLSAVAQRMVDLAEPVEQLGDGCRFCTRKLACGKLTEHVAAGGSLSITDPTLAAQRYYELAAAQVATKKMMEDLEVVIMDDLKKDGEVVGTYGDFDVSVSVSGRRNIDSKMLAKVIPPDVFAAFGDMKISAVDDLLKSNKIDEETKSRVRQLIGRNYSEPTLKVTKKGPF